MAQPIRARLRNAWNAFNSRDPTYQRAILKEYGTGQSNPSQVKLSRGNERSIINAVYTRLANDIAEIPIRHCKVDKNGNFQEAIDDNLDRIFNLEANIDQSGRAFMLDVVMSLFDEGCVALVPVDTDVNPMEGSYEVLTMRTGRITEWFPNYVRVNVYNDRKGQREDILLPKANVGIVENPFYSVMNEPNSTLKRLVRKLNLLDAIDEQSGSGKLDLIIQLPYVIKSEARREQAEQRRKDIEMQLKGSKYGIAYTDGTEHITQLNRPVENNMLDQIEYLTNLLYSQLGMTEEIMQGKADEQTMLNYTNRTVVPIVYAITSELRRKFLTPTARKQGHDIKAIRDPFKLVPVSNLAEIADKFTRNEILTPNEIRAIIGYYPSEDPKSDELRNRNIAESGEQAMLDAQQGGQMVDPNAQMQQPARPGS